MGNPAQAPFHWCAAATDLATSAEDDCEANLCNSASGMVALSGASIVEVRVGCGFGQMLPTASGDRNPDARESACPAIGIPTHGSRPVGGCGFGQIAAKRPVGQRSELAEMFPR